MIKDNDLTKDQSSAILTAKKWWSDVQAKGFQKYKTGKYEQESQTKPSQIFYLAGYSGCGKTSIIENILCELKIPKYEAVLAAFTGKASLILSQKTGTQASTIHSLIYQQEEDTRTGKQIWVKKASEKVQNASVIVLDEVSMLNCQMVMDLADFEKPMIAIGDPYQLPPVDGKQFFHDKIIPNVLLKEVTRQAAESPVHHIAHCYLRGQQPRPGSYGKKVWVGSRSKLETRHYTNVDQVLCALNRTRREINSIVRQYYGYESIDPQDPDNQIIKQGEKLIVLKNDWERKIFNGTQLTAFDNSWRLDHQDENFCITSTHTYGEQLPDGFYERFMTNDTSRFELDKQPSILIENIETYIGFEFYRELSIEQQKREREIKENWKSDLSKKIRNTLQVAPAYAITTHKAQGGEWDSVLFLKENFFSHAQTSRLAYTACTRARESLLVAL